MSDTVPSYTFKVTKEQADLMKKHAKENAFLTCSQICIDADNHRNDLMHLIELKKYVVKNKYQYPLVQLRFMIEYIDECINDAISFECKLIAES